MKSPYTLATIALLIALIWRLEVEFRGWDGLTWIGYFHLAIPRLTGARPGGSHTFVENRVDDTILRHGSRPPSLACEKTMFPRPCLKLSSIRHL